MKSRVAFWPCSLIFWLLLFSYAGVGFAQAATPSDKIIHTFTGGTDGERPYSELLLDKNGNLFGTTLAGGGVGTCDGFPGCGIVFELSPGVSGWTETILYVFTGSSDGGSPIGGLVMDKSGNLYGTTALAGGDAFCGTVFELSPAAGGGWTESTLYQFKGGAENDGCSPQATLTLDAKGNLYGTTYAGGSPDQNAGIVFELSLPFAGGSWIETVLVTFDYTNGGTPGGKLALDATDHLYGTTLDGGSFGWGSVFKLTPGPGGWSASTIFSFTCGDNGGVPYGVVFDKTGHLYGTTSQCGADDVGTVFRLSPTIGQWSMTVLHTFTGALDGGEPIAGLAIDSAGNLYGTTWLGGLFAEGTVFKLELEGTRWIEGEYGFKGGSDGAMPQASPTLGKSVLYGTTTYDGTSGLGTVYEIDLSEL